MKKIAKLSLAAALAASVTVVSAADLYTGSEGKNYHGVVGPSLVKESKEFGVHMNNTVGEGSVSNMDEIIGTGNYALAQANVSNPLIDNDDKYASLDIIGSVGMECGFLVVPSINKNGRTIPAPLSSLADEKITIGKIGSGDAFSYDQLKTNNPVLAAFDISNRSSSLRALGKVAGGRQGAAFFFSVPDKNNKLIKEVTSNPNITFADAEEINLGELGEGKRPALFKQDLTINKQTFTAVCTNINVVADMDKVSEDEADKVYQATKKVKTEALTLSGALSSAQMKALEAASGVMNFFKSLR